jgi:trimeric autotransporter adhesin
MRWVMKTTPTPSRLSRPTISNRRSRVATSSAEVASSSIRTRGRCSSARTMQQACRSLSESSSAALSRSSRRSRSSSRSSWARARFSRVPTRVRSSPSWPSQTLSTTELASATSTSWNTVAMPCSRAARGDVSGRAAAPSISISPMSGAWTPVRIFTSVLLPEPFSPTIAWTSPGSSSKEASRRACVSPNAFPTPVTRTSGALALSASATAASACVMSASRPTRCAAAPGSSSTFRRSLSVRRAGGAAGP